MVYNDLVKDASNDQEIQDIRMDSFQMNNGDPPPPVSGAGGGHPRNANGNISMDSAIAALEQHDTLFHRQVMHLRQQQVLERS